MTKRLFVLGVALLAMRALVAAADADPNDNEMKAIVRKWTLKTVNGHDLVKPNGSFDLTADNKYTRRIDQNETSGAFTIDAMKTPKEFNLTIEKGTEKEKGKVQKGIYRIDGGALTTCLGAPGEDRPTTFDAGNETAFPVLEVWNKD